MLSDAVKRLAKIFPQWTTDWGAVDAAAEILRIVAAKVVAEI
jgi:hypothetical protein